MTSHGAVRAEVRDDVLVLTLSDPERRNALSNSMLATFVEEMQANATVRAVVVTGEPPAFCAGANLASARDEDFQESLAAALGALVGSPVPCIAAVDGPAFGAGMQLVAACDLRVATARSTFAVPAARLGLVVDPATVRMLERALGDAVAREMLLSAGTWSAERLARTGFVHRVADVAAAIEWALEVAALAPLSHAGHKAALRGDVSGANEIRARASESVDASEGRAAFAERRPPRFIGR